MKHFVSVVIPLFNEEENVRPLYEELCIVLGPSEHDYEFLFIDDGSSDNTRRELLDASAGDERVKLISFRRNFGQTAAMAAGLDYAQGDVVITMDGDMQNDPAEIPRMVAMLNDDCDLVAGWRKDRQDTFITRKLPSMLANRLISAATDVRLHDYGCTLKAMKSDVAKNIRLYGEMHRFIPALAAVSGAKIAEIPVNHRARTAGTTKYGISRTFRVLLDLLTVKFFLGFSTRPLHMFGYLGFVSGGLGGLLLALLAFEKVFLGMPIGTRPALLLGVMLVLIGLQFLSFGLLAELLTRTYHESQDKKIYAVREVLRPSGTDVPGDGRRSRKVVGTI